MGKRLAGIVAGLAALAAVLAGAEGAAARRDDPMHRIAERQFMALDPDLRLWLQIILTSAGHWQAVPNLSYSTRLYDAVRRLQLERGESPTGVLTHAQVKEALEAGGSVLAGWGLRRFDHPFSRAWIWILAGLDPLVTPSPGGAHISAGRSRLRIRFEYFPGKNLAESYQAIVSAMQRGGDLIVYRVLKRDFLVVAGRQGPHQRYVRYHDDGTGLVGVDMTWSGEDPPVYGERLSTIVSASLWASMTGARLPSLPRYGAVTEPSRPPVPPPATPPAQSRPAREKPPERGLSTGSGFSVSASGHFLTNAHVARDCRAITVRAADQAAVPATLLARDETNDLALLHAPAAAGTPPLPLRPGVRLGENVAAFGFPHSDILSTSGNFTVGNVTALSGLQDDSRFLQISAPVQAGNSGGSLLDQWGNVTGVVTSKLNALRVMAKSGDLPQNVNFAVKASLAAGFLDARQVPWTAGAPGARKLEPPDLAELARRSSVFVACMR